MKDDLFAAFKPGDEVFLAKGPYQCTIGTFVRVREDAGWADITEGADILRAHPLAWLRHRPDGQLNWSVLLHGTRD
jgi:hypothetical protein